VLNYDVTVHHHIIKGGYIMIDRIKRCLTMLEKAINRLGRSKYYSRKQYPPIFIEIEAVILKIRIWLDMHKAFESCNNYFHKIGCFIKDLVSLIGLLKDLYKPKKGKKEEKQVKRDRDQKKLIKSIDSMIENIAELLKKAKKNDGTIFGAAFEDGLEDSFYKDIIHDFKKKVRELVSQRGEKTFIFPFVDKDKYHSLIKDRKKFRTEVLDKLSRNNTNGHKASCKGAKRYILRGFRAKPRKSLMVGGKQEIFQIRMVECKNCGQKFSLVPSFLPREKNFAIEIIGNVVRNLTLYQQSLQGVLESIKIIGKRSVKSKQTILNWLKWLGIFHPAAVLTRAGVKGSGYLQEDEGFEKEPNLRTYSVVMVDPKTLLVWHADYVDHVDEATLHESFQTFVEKIDFKILGITKDKWKASTKALKTVFHKIWIGYCHRHCLKNFRKALEKYQKEVKCSEKEVKELYKKFRTVLKMSTSKANLNAKVKSLAEKAFSHPILQDRIAELKENAAHYTAHKNRQGITETTSIVDNFLKIVKRKLAQVESFRDREWAEIFFRALANIRNFVPFTPSAKNAHKSPFMLAGGQSYDLPWIQVMNLHNAFLFTENASGSAFS